MNYIIALDAGTTSVRAMLYDLKEKKFVYHAQQEVEQSFPQSGWVEQDAAEIYYKCAYALDACVRFAGAEHIAGIGIANQRETVVLWDRKTGEPIAPAIVWQCRRTSEMCAKIPQTVRETIREKTGLLPDAYFSATKIAWLLEHVPKAKELIFLGRLCAGTVDSYLIFRLTGNFATDYTNASRTMLFNIHTLEWDEELCSYFAIPREILPAAKPCDFAFGNAKLGGREIPVCAAIGDQQAALFGQACLKEGEAKITYGTGLFLLFHTGERCVESKSGLLSTVGYSVGGKTFYALEGSAFNAGSSVQWLRDGLRILSSSEESEELAQSVPDSGGVCFVPAFTGLGAPHWNSEARGLLCGITRGCKRAHIVRAVLESIAFGARELSDCMQKDSGIPLREIKCDGGASANNFLMQFQANVLNCRINRPVERESTALGAALMAAVSLGMIGVEEVEKLRTSQKIFSPNEGTEEANEGYLSYLLAVKRALMTD